MKKLLLLIASALSLSAGAAQNGGTLSKSPGVLWMDSATIAMVMGASDVYVLGVLSSARITDFHWFASEPPIEDQGNLSEHRHIVWDPIVKRVYDVNAKNAQTSDVDHTDRIRRRLKLLTERREDIASTSTSTWFVPLDLPPLSKRTGYANYPLQSDNGEYFVIAKLPSSVCTGYGSSTDVKIKGRPGTVFRTYCITFDYGGIPESAIDHGVGIRIADSKAIGEMAYASDVPLVFGVFAEPTLQLNSTSSGCQGCATTLSRVVRIRYAALVNPVSGKVLCTVPLKLKPFVPHSPKLRDDGLKVERMRHELVDTATCGGDM